MKEKTLHLKRALRCVLFILLLCMAGMTKGYAYDFSAVCETGQTLYYTITDVSAHMVELTDPNSTSNESWCGYQKPTGDIILPSSVEHNGIVYSVTSIGDWAFRSCDGLTGSLIIPNSVTRIGGSAFRDCSGFTGSLTIPNSVTEICGGAFAGCSGLTGSLIIPNSVTEIVGDAFRYCNGFTSLTIPNSITSIGSYAFQDCSGFTGSLTIPNFVTSIGDFAFSGCSGLTGSLTIPNSVTSISNHAFSECRGFTGSLNIPNSVTSIGNDAFSGCSGFTSLTIPNSVTSIGNYAFSGCGFTSLTIPNSVTSIGNFAFTACRNFTGSLSIPNSVTTIGEGAFQDCSGFTGSLIIPNSVTEISDRAFCRCSGFTSLTIPNSVTSIGNYAFWDCSGFTGALTIPNSVTSIGNLAFSGCNGFTGSLTITNSVTTIGYSAFSGCSGFTGSLTIGNSVTSIGEHTFSDCSGFSGSLTIGESVTSIGRYAFFNCSGFTGSLNIPNSVTEIANSAFAVCSGFTSLTIPNSVISIGEYAFGNCNDLTEIIIYRANPSTLGNGAFYDTNYSLIYVPYESINSYKTAGNWASYEDRIYPMAYATIPSYGESTGNYRFIASPLAGDTDPTAIDNLITASKYDLYRFDQSEDAEWQNYKDPNVNNFTIANGQGYLYANESEVNIIFKGAFNENGTQNVNLAYDDNAVFKGLNLVGNPFPVNAYINRSYYVMNDEGTEVTPVAVSTSTPIPACAGVMVFAESGETDPTVTFSKTAPQSASSNGSLQISVAHNSSKGSAIIDNAIVSFNDGDALGKYNFNDGDARLYIQQGSKELAIAYAGNQGEMPLNFKAKANGTYKISVNPEDVEMEYLHIIDNLTGNDTDLLQTPSYTFDASKADYASRFKLVFKANGVADNSSSADSETFAYCNGSEWVIENEGEATLQVIDLTGRILISEQISGSCSKTFSSHGVNMLRLINGDSVKTQKIVVR